SAARDPFGAGAAVHEAMISAMSHPERLVQAQGDLLDGYMALWTGAAKRMTGGETAPAIAPEPGDRRFTAPAWSENPWFDMIKQAYLLNARFMRSVVDAAEDL